MYYWYKCVCVCESVLTQVGVGTDQQLQFALGHHLQMQCAHPLLFKLTLFLIKQLTPNGQSNHRAQVRHVYCTTLTDQHGLVE